MNRSSARRDTFWRKADPRWHFCGIADTVYTDNGGDFTSRHLDMKKVHDVDRGADYAVCRRVPSFGAGLPWRY